MANKLTPEPGKMVTYVDYGTTRVADTTYILLAYRRYPNAAALACHALSLDDALALAAVRTRLVIQLRPDIDEPAPTQPEPKPDQPSL